MTVLSVVGARPQFIKAFAVSRELRPQQDEVLVHTGQHYDEELSDVFFEELGIPEPDYNLGVGSAPQGHQTAAMIKGIEAIVEEVDPNQMLLYGDTNSTLAGSIVGSKLDMIVAHVEAGLRSFNRTMSEETNRVLTDHASDLLFAPSQTAVENLAHEGITDGVYQTGDVMYDTLLWARDRAKENSNVLSKLEVEPDKFVLTTVHRAENTDNCERLEAIVDGLSSSPLPVIFPAHPRVVDRLERYGLWTRASESMQIIDPVGYFDFIRLLDASERVATDSGGIQKEAFFLDTPCITLRDETEWVETVDCGWNELVGADDETIAKALHNRQTLSEKPAPYGDGRAAENILKVLLDAR
ncbi:non-hydrolyzing UDP-N-acetylglucosamine 2-epimerase [Natrialbaceae archaeon A-CW3]